MSESRRATEPDADLQFVNSDKCTSEGKENYKQLNSHWKPPCANGGEYHAESDAVRGRACFWPLEMSYESSNGSYYCEFDNFRLFSSQLSHLNFKHFKLYFLCFKTPFVVNVFIYLSLPQLYYMHHHLWSETMTALEKSRLTVFHSLTCWGCQKVLTWLLSVISTVTIQKHAQEAEEWVNSDCRLFHFHLWS